MNKQITLAITSTCILVSCSAAKDGTVFVVTDTIEETQSAYSISAKIPQVKGDLDAATLSDINDRLEKFGKDARTKFLHEIENMFIDPGQSQKSGLVIRFESKTVSANLLSIVMEVSPYIAGAAHPNVRTESFAYDIVMKKQLSLTDMFNQNTKYLERLSELSIKQLIDTSKKNNTYYEAKLQMIKQGAAPKEENFKTFAIKDGSLIVLFDPYQVGPYAEGVQTVTLKRADITDVLSNQGRKLLSESQIVED